MNYKLWHGTHKFFFNGRVMAGPHWHHAFLTLFVYLFAQALTVNFTLVPLAGRKQVFWIVISSALTAVTVVLMLMTAFTDPGVIPSRASLCKKELTRVPY